MANRASLMFDSMFTAVDEGLSYDGIVSAPGTGLEDRSRLTVLLDESVDLARMARVAVLRGATSVFHGQPQRDRPQPTFALPVTVVQAPARFAEDLVQAPGVNRTTQPNLMHPEVDHQNLPTGQSSGPRLPPVLAGDNKMEIGTVTQGGPEHMSSLDLVGRDIVVTQRNQPSMRPSEDDGALRAEPCIQSNVASSRMDNRNPPVVPEIDALSLQDKDDDRPVRTRTAPDNTSEKSIPSIPPHFIMGRIRVIALVATCTTAMVVHISNITSVSIALPGIGRASDIREDQLQWLLSAYFLGAGLLSFPGCLAGNYGRKRAFLFGTIWQAGFAVGCGLSSDVVTLAVLRGLQGMGAAMVVTSASDILAESFPLLSGRSTAFLIFGLGKSVGGPFGMIIGGELTKFLSRNSPFFLSAVLSIPCVICGLILFDRKDIFSKTKPRVDWIGIALLACGLVLIVFALGQGPIVGWKTPYIITSLVVGVSLMGGFLIWERKSRTPLPVMKPSLWARARGRMAAVLAILFLNGCSFMSWTLWVQLYYQYYLQFSPLRTVTRLIPMFITDLLCTFFLPALVTRVPAVALAVFGNLSAAAACVLFALINPSVTYWAFSFPSTVLVVVGSNIVHAVGSMFAVRIMALDEQPPSQAMSQIGGVFGLVASTIAFRTVIDRQSAKLGIPVDVIESNTPSLAELQGYKAAQWTGAGCSFLAALLAAIFLRGSGIVGNRLHALLPVSRRLGRDFPSGRTIPSGHTIKLKENISK